MLLKTPKATPPDPEALALQALVFLMADDDRLARFLGLTGLDGNAVRELAHDPHGLGAVLDYLLGFEPLLLEFAAEIGVDPAVIAAQRRRLPD
ncbi:DUF3572 domain-containing protein [Dongia mobilis]|jgi:hypothetical protein|uniref:DUF3572 domain-containing protein n=1 Tax=Dongia sp. TaxID=1977262 RepID=UPI0026EE470F